MSEKHVRAWHFCADGKLRDGQKVVVGKTYTVKGPLVMCKHGLHWSRRIIDALQYAPGDTICLVEAWGDVQEQEDKGVSRHRKVIVMVNGKKLLRLFACDYAEEALTRFKIRDKRSWKAVEMARKYANGKATKKEVSAAWSAVCKAPWNAARTAVWSAARSAACNAAWNAAMNAANDTASDAAWYAAWSEARDATWNAAMDAARNGAWSSLNDRLTASVLKAMKRKSMDDGEVTHGPA